jgi:outer membrane protein TolC
MMFVVRIGFLLLGLTGISFAQGQVITREDALRIIQNSAIVQAAKARLDAAKALLSPFPISVTGALVGGYGFRGSSTTTATGDFQGGINITASFPGIFSDASDTRLKAERNFERAQVQLRATQNRASLRALQLWHYLKNTEKKQQIAGKTLELSQLEDKIAEERLLSGAINRYDRDIIKQRLLESEFNLRLANETFSYAAKQLSVELNVPVTKPSPVLWQMLRLPTKTINIDWREDVTEARLAWLEANLELERVRRAIAPTVNLTTGITGSAGSAQVTVNSNLGVTANYQFTTTVTAPTTTNWSVGLSISIPLNSAPLTQLDSLTQQVNISKIALEQTLRNAQFDVEIQLAQVGNKQSLLDFAQNRERNSLLKLEAQKQRFELGLSSRLDVLRGELDLLNAELEILSAQSEVDQSILVAYQTSANLYQS